MERYRMYPGETLMDDLAEGTVLPTTITIPGIGTVNLPGAGGTDAPGSPDAGTTDPNADGAGGGASGGASGDADATKKLDITKLISSIQTAPMKDECRVRANRILNELLAAKAPTPEDIGFIQAVALAAQGLGEYPPECVPTPWWWWFAAGAGILLTGWLVYYYTRKKNKGGRKRR